MVKAATRKRITPDAGTSTSTPRNIGRPHALARSPGDPAFAAYDAMVTKDTLTNVISGMGTHKDKATHTFFGYAQMNRDQLDAAYRGDWIARKSVDIVPDDSTREWRAWQGEKEEITNLENEEKRLKLQRKVLRAMQWANLYGGAALILGVDGQGDAKALLDWTKVKKDQLKFVHVVSRFDLSHDGQLEEDLTSEFYGEPKMWKRYTVNGNYLEIHPSRIIKFIGKEHPDPNTSDTWGDSVLQVIGDAITGAGTVTQSVAQLVAEAKIDIVKLPGMSEKMSSQKYQDNLKARFGNASMMKSLYNTLLVDAAEEWERLNQNFTGLDDILKMYLLISCAANDIPATRFLSQSPAGLSSTGDADLRNYYDKVSSGQNNDVTPTLERLDNVLIMSSLGKRPDEIWYEWNPLWQLTPTEAATIAVQKSVVMTADVNAGLFPPQMLYEARLNQLIEDGTYPGLEQIEDEYGDDIEERQAQEQEAEAERLMAQAAANANDPAGVNPGEQVPPGTKKVPPSTAKGGSVPPKRPAVADGASMADRISGRSLRLDDATSPPKPLYVHRKVLNQAELKAWAKKAGFATSLDDMHVTVIYSKTPVDWLQVPTDYWTPNADDDGKLTIPPGGPRVMQQFGKAVVLSFANTGLQYRHASIMREADGISYDHDDYTPHITITYGGMPDGSADITMMKAYQGKIVLGPELFEDIIPGFNNETDVDES